MQPREITPATSFGPDALGAIFRAFDDAWSELAPKLDTEPASVESARLALARVVLALAAADAIAPDGLKTMAIAVFCAKHRIEIDSAA